MCGRISQYRDPRLYTQHLGLADPLMLFDAADRRPGYNLAPGTHPLAIFADQTLRPVHWGYCPDWAREQHLPQTINARADAAPTARYFEELWKTGRVLVPADGWFEWRRTGAPIVENAGNAPEAVPTGASSDAMSRQPYFVHLKSAAPMYLAALSSVRGSEPQTEGMGLVIVTANADAGLVDVYDRRPLAFGPEAARRWLEPDLPADELEQLARTGGLAAGRFRWHRVSHDVDRTLNDEPGLIEALA
ncbi:SOS response-associated peptidase family protein [Paraburkholderia bryophila]|uniref:Abasic site processing protein n=1 Tax=Paraburkholderia bryophila TaxID=420952 RepID=A0A329BAN4_9BURK|nr:SOS response-associated peptidase family protein [Paraburkholderia bryophila]RAS19508.1 putative SOS response-associated peptidase YedK [Paraburkholderia bryophila]